MENNIRTIYQKHHYTYKLPGNLRFELAQGDNQTHAKQIENGKLRGLELFKDIFQFEQTIQLVLFLPQNHKKINFKRFLHNNTFRIIDSFETNAWQEYYDDSLTVLVIEVPLTNLRLGMLLDGIIYQDFRPIGKIQIKHPIVFYNKNKEVLLNIYDDRGADLYAFKKKLGLVYYHHYYDWLLDYDLHTMTAFYG